MDDVGSSKWWRRLHNLVDIIHADFQTLLSHSLQNISTYVFCTAERISGTVMMQNSRLNHSNFIWDMNMTKDPRTKNMGCEKQTLAYLRVVERLHYCRVRVYTNSSRCLIIDKYKVVKLLQNIYVWRRDLETWVCLLHLYPYHNTDIDEYHKHIWLPAEFIWYLGPILKLKFSR